MSGILLPTWAEKLTEDDLTFIKNFIVSSGSLKETAGIYDVTYPTVRLKLDRIIGKIKDSDSQSVPKYVSLIRRLAVDDHIDLETAQLLIDEFKKQSVSQLSY